MIRGRYNTKDGGFVRVYQVPGGYWMYCGWQGNITEGRPCSAGFKLTREVWRQIKEDHKAFNDDPAYWRFKAKENKV